MTDNGFKTRRYVSFLAKSCCFLALAGALHRLKQKSIKSHLQPTQEDVLLRAGASMSDYGFKTRWYVSFLAKAGGFQAPAGDQYRLK